MDQVRTRASQVASGDFEVPRASVDSLAGGPAGVMNSAHLRALARVRRGRPNKPRNSSRCSSDSPKYAGCADHTCSTPRALSLTSSGTAIVEWTPRSSRMPGARAYRPQRGRPGRSAAREGPKPSVRRRPAAVDPVRVRAVAGKGKARADLAGFCPEWAESVWGTSLCPRVRRARALRSWV